MEHLPTHLGHRSWLNEEAVQDRRVAEGKERLGRVLPRRDCAGRCELAPDNVQHAHKQVERHSRAAAACIHEQREPREAASECPARLVALPTHQLRSELTDAEHADEAAEERAKAERVGVCELAQCGFGPAPLASSEEERRERFRTVRVEKR